MVRTQHAVQAPAAASGRSVAAPRTSSLEHGRIWPAASLFFPSTSSAMQALAQQFTEARLADVQTTLSYAGALLQHGSLAPPSDAQLAALLSTLGLVAAINVTLMLLVPRGRKLVLDTVETVLAIALLAVLIVTVLGLPLGERPSPPPVSACEAHKLGSQAIDISSLCSKCMQTAG